jgi:MFS family permease
LASIQLCAGRTHWVEGTVTDLTTLIRRRRYVVFWLSQATSRLGDGVTLVALAFLLIHSRGTIVFGAVLAVEAAAMSVLTLVGGVFADRHSRTRVMVVADVSRFAGVLGFLLAAAHGPIAAVLVSAALVGAGTALYAPAHRSALPQLVPEEDLRQLANSVDSATAQLAAAGGAALAAGIVAAFSARLALGVDLATFAVSLACLGWIRLEPVPAGDDDPATAGDDDPATAGTGAVRQFWADVKGGFAEIRRHPWAAAIMGQGTLQMIFVFTPAYALIPIVAQDRYQAGAFGYLSAAQFLGAMAGSLLVSRLRPAHRGLWAVNALAPSTLVPVCLGIHVPLWVFCAICVVAWAGISVFIVLWYTALQDQIPPARQGRVFSLDSLANFGLEPIPLALAPLIARHLGLAPIAWTGLVVMLVTTYGVLLVPGVRALRDTGVPAPEEGARL